jgi:transposase
VLDQEVRGSTHSVIALCRTALGLVPLPNTHGLNTSILSLNRFKFRQLLQAKCAIKGKSVVVCSEMFTSRTCRRCYRAGRDETAALNILRCVCAGSLQVFE